MANGDGMNYGCHCGRPWMSILPPPPCLHHSQPTRVIHFDVAVLCRGRHCQHDMHCRGGVTFNG